jgi:serine/threonine-protein kinase CTR1
MSNCDEDDRYSSDDFEESHDSSGLCGSVRACVEAQRSEAKSEAKSEGKSETKSEAKLVGQCHTNINMTSASASPTNDELGGWKEIKEEELEQGPQIGGGGFALVYRGRYKGRSVALKTLFDPNFDQIKDEYFDELRVMARLKHPCIVELVGACVRPPRLFFVMELCGQTLYRLVHIERREPGQKRLCNLAADVASALAYMHSRRPSVTHRDIKSQNVLLSRDGTRAKLCDFGLVSTRKRGAGTPHYMAPELIQERPYNCSVDVYAFGILLWEMFTRRIPFDGWDPSDIVRKVIAGERPELPETGLPNCARTLIPKCWHQDAMRRPHANILEKELREAAGRMREVSHVAEMKSGGALDSMDALMASLR